MFKGEPVIGIEFYKLLLKDEDFSSELGRVALASGRLEVELLLYLTRNNVIVKNKSATLGSLITIGKKNNLLDENLILALKMISKQRNYFTHNIYALFTNLIDVTILKRDNLIDTDVITYTDYAYRLRENLEGLADVISRKGQNN